MFGAVTAVTGLAGTFLGSYLADVGDHATPQLRTLHSIKLVVIEIALSVPLGMAAFAVDNLYVSFVLLFFSEFLIFMTAGPLNGILLSTVPHSLRSPAMAVNILCIHLFGDLMSPPVVGALMDAVRPTKNPHDATNSRWVMMGYVLIVQQSRITKTFVICFFFFSFSFP